MQASATVLLQLGTFAVRGFPWLVAAMILWLPATKGLWLGYVPVALGAGAACWLMARYDLLVHALGRWTRDRLVLAAIVLPLLVQVALLLLVRPEPTLDGLFVYRHTVALLETGRYDPLTYYPPAQSWWYAGWFSLFGTSTLVAQLSQLPLSAMVTWLTLKLARELTGEGEARMAALAVAWYPSFLGYVLVTPYYHYLYTALTLGMVLGVLRFWGSGVLGFWSSGVLGFGGSGVQMRDGGVPTSDLRPLVMALLAGLAAGLGALTKAVQLIAPLQVLTWLMVLGLVAMATGRVKAFPWRRILSGLLLFGLGMLVVVGPWMLRNYRVFDAWVPVCTSGGLVLYSANNPSSNGLYSGIPDDADVQTPADMLAHSRWCSDQAKTWMAENPGSFLRLAANKFLHTWGVEATFADLINVRGTRIPWVEQGASLVFHTGWVTLVVLWLGGSIRAFRRSTPVSAFGWLAGVIILSNAVVYLVYEGGDRHHLPLVPLILLSLVGGSARPTASGEDNVQISSKMKS